MIQWWKVPSLLKGALSCIPALDRLRLRRAATGGSSSARYCYSVWLRHFQLLNANGFSVAGAEVGEIGPGDSIGTGLAALLSGAKCYVALDVVPFSARADLGSILEELGQMFSRQDAIPDHREFPGIRPRLDTYGFPHDLVDCANIVTRTAAIRRELDGGLKDSRVIRYHVPWTSSDIVASASLDLIFSQAALEHVDALEETYMAMYTWLKPGGYASHVIDFSAHHLSPYWNGHWAFTDWQWPVVRGRREFLLNREPLSVHLRSARRAGFEIIQLQKETSEGGLGRNALAKRFRILNEEDLQTRVAVLILRKPASPAAGVRLSSSAGGHAVQ